MNSKSWIKKLFLIISVLIILVYSVNFFVDPLWVFNHKNKFNSKQEGFNERVQKSIKLKYNTNLKNIDTLLIGSSRVRYYNQNNFKNKNVFNYAFSGAMPYEYNEYIQFAKYLKKDEFKNIIIGLDFFGINKKPITYKNQDIKSKLDVSKYEYSFKNYLSYSSLKYSYKNIKNSKKSKLLKSYNRDNICQVFYKRDEKKVEKEAIKRSKDYYLKKNLKKYNNEYINTLKEIKQNNKNSNFIVFTTPLSKPFLDAIYNDKKLKEFYFRWIDDMVLVFGKVYFFTLPSKLSAEYKIYSADGDHFYPDTCDNIIDIITNDKKVNNYNLIINNNNLLQSKEIILNKINNTK